MSACCCCAAVGSFLRLSKFAIPTYVDTLTKPDDGFVNTPQQFWCATSPCKYASASCRSTDSLDFEPYCLLQVLIVFGAGAPGRIVPPAGACACPVSSHASLYACSCTNTSAAPGLTYESPPGAGSQWTASCWQRPSW
jgi:hypothetical protein